MEGRELPVGWATAHVGEVCRLLNGRAYSKSELLETGKYAVLRVGNLFTNPHWYHSDLELDDDKYCQAGDLLYAWSASFGPHVWEGEKVIYHYHIWKVEHDENLIHRDFLKVFFHWDTNRIKQQQGSGSTMLHVTKKSMEERAIPVPPTSEQRRIAAKLDTTLAAVESCRQRLDGVAAILKRFRQAVLAAATSGELTREWRGERGMADFWKTKVLSEIADSRLGKMLDQGKNTGRLTPYLRNINVRWFSFDLDDIQEMRLEDAEIIDLDVRFGDLFVCEGGEPGRCAVWRGEDSKYTFQKALHRVRTSQHLLADYLSFCLSNAASNGKLEELFTGTTIKHLTGASLKKFQIPLPSREEQEEIVDHVKSLFTLADQLEARLTAARKVVDRLTPALLAKAFRGELVPQDPTDEPASVLFERIRAARQAAAGAGKHSRRGRPKAAANPAPVDRNAAPAPSEPLPPDLLTQLLRECGALSERALLAVSELEPERFEQQLFRELEKGTAREVQANGQVVLEAVG